MGLKSIQPRVSRLPEGTIYTESMFVDSGAHSLYNIHVLKHRDRKGRHGRELARPPVRWSQGDFSFYDLRPGTEFREYCDRYARFMKQMVARDKTILLANVDAISNPDLTWQIQKFFENEHGVTPVPIVHYGTPMKYVDRYLEGGYPLLGVGGLGQGVSRHEYFQWGDEFFLHICPKPSRLPLIKTHGFAMTSWELICRWPWWSVDSATWVKLSAYGWIYVPRWRRRFRFDLAPLMVSVSAKSPRLEETDKHIENVTEAVRDNVLMWLEYLKIPLGRVNKKGEMVEFGVASHHRARSIANLSYLKDLEESRPPWPHPLDPDIVNEVCNRYHRKGLGL